MSSWTNLGFSQKMCILTFHSNWWYSGQNGSIIEPFPEISLVNFCYYNWQNGIFVVHNHYKSERRMMKNILSFAHYQKWLFFSPYVWVDLPQYPFRQCSRSCPKNLKKKSPFEWISHTTTKSLRLLHFDLGIFSAPDASLVVVTPLLPKKCFRVERSKRV